MFLDACFGLAKPQPPPLAVAVLPESSPLAPLGLALPQPPVLPLGFAPQLLPPLLLEALEDEAEGVAPQLLPPWDLVCVGLAPQLIIGNERGG